MVDQLFNSLLPSLDHIQSLGYWLAFLAALLETTLVLGLLIPGSSLLLLLGAFAATGHLEFNGLLWFAVAGAMIGDNLNYWLGRRHGRHWLQGGVWFIRPKHFEQAEDFFDRHGGRSIFLGRFVPSLKELVPFLAGTAHMRLSRFMLWNLLGAIGWGLEWLGAGYLFARSLDLAQLWLSRAGLALLLLLLGMLLLWQLQRLLLRHGRELLDFSGSMAHALVSAVFRQSVVQDAVQRHPRLVAALQARLDRHHFNGLPLTLLGLAFLYVLGLFGGVIEDLITADPIVALDHSLAQLVARFRPGQVVLPAIWITDLGIWQVVLPLLASSLLILWRMRLTWMSLPLIVTSLGASAFTYLGKLAFQRPRPAEALLLEHSYAFPSGHATIAVAFYGFITYLLIRTADNWRRRVNLFIVGTLLILSIGLSRIVLGVHYLSDVWAGYLIGTLWLIIGISLGEWLIACGRLRLADRRPVRGTAWLLAGLTAVAFSIFATHQQPRWAPPLQRPVQQLTVDVIEWLKSHSLVYSRTPLGAPQQPIGLLLAAQDIDNLHSQLQQAGWQDAAPITPGSLLRLASEGIRNPQPPVGPAFWQQRIDDLALVRQVSAAGSTMVYVMKVWDSGMRSGHLRLFATIVQRHRGLRWGLLPKISPDLDAARDQVYHSLREIGQVKTTCERPLQEATVGDFPLGGSWFTRGGLRVILLASDNEGVARLCPAIESTLHE